MWRTGTVISYLLWLKYQCSVEVICFICVTVNSYNCNYFKVKYYLPEFLHMLKIGNVCTDPLEKGTVSLNGRVKYVVVDTC